MGIESEILYQELVSIVEEIFEDHFDSLDDAGQGFIADLIDSIECGEPFKKDDAAAIVQLAKDFKIRNLN